MKHENKRTIEQTVKVIPPFDFGMIEKGMELMKRVG